MEKTFEEVYGDPRQPGSFQGPEKLIRGLKKVKNIDATLGKVKQWMEKKDTYTKFRVARRNFKRNPVIAEHIDAQWQGDLAEVGNLAAYNDGIRYILILIDVVSKYVWVEPLKTKSGPSMVEAFKKLFQRIDRKPMKLQTDDGKEFWFSGVQAFLKENNIQFFTLKSDKKASIAERMVRTLKEKIWRYMHEKNTKRYIDVLQDLVSSYNDTYHKAIQMPPSEVDATNEGLVLRRLYGKAWAKVSKEHQKKKKKPVLKKGDFVRISSVKGAFKKGYMGNWSEEIFIIDDIIYSKPFFLYKLKDWNQEKIDGSFYEKEVQLVSKGLDDYWKVEKIIRERVVRGKRQYFVKWLGYPDDMNSWVDDIKAI